ncbi:reductase [Rhodococcus sp. CUA-806]|jgi:cytochrome P450/NADPH-cytochrome P450 reductase|nr:reductase [Rhodococcus sp. CUA-806]OLT34989.1 reductase [Rhodococcus sp. CUA-806]
MSHHLTISPTPTPIPERPVLPYVGHALGIPRGNKLVDHLLDECEQLGPIFRLRIFGNDQIIVSGSDLVSELTDPSVFSKCVHSDLIRLRDIGGDGLFTAYNEEPNWRRAHNILMPSFTRDAMRQYHGKMVSAARNLIGSWERAASRDGDVDVSRDMTRLTFDTIGMCGFGYEFDSFSTDVVHPFIESMVRALVHAQELSEMPPFVNKMRVRSNRRYADDLTSMQRLITEVIERRRREDPTRDDDLLGRMLNTVDPETGLPLDDANIRYQVITFLIAGHETTGAAMSFALHYLSKHPAVLARAQSEVDGLWGTEDDIAPSFEDVGKLTYVRQVLDEALRLWPTAPGFAVSPNKDVVIGGGYQLRRGDTVQIFIPALHRQAEWGSNVHGFDPDRFAPEAIEQRPGHVYKPFGHGERACIGRQFALHEATLVLAMLVHRFVLDDRANYQLSLGMTLTIKPENFRLSPRARASADRTSSIASNSSIVGSVPPSVATLPPTAHRGDVTAVTLLHGSNLGTSAAVARELATAAKRRGLGASVAPLDNAVGAIETMSPDHAVIVVASSYNGRPTDDASRFFDWVQQLEAGSLDGLNVAVLGIGDRSYADTYQRVPTVIDESLARAGATRLLPRGAADVGGDYSAVVQKWTEHLWSILGNQDGVPTERTSDGENTRLTIELIDPLDETRVRAHGLEMMEVIESRELVDTAHPLGRSKRYLRIRLPAGIHYRTGDHLAVLPSNPKTLTDRVIARFGLRADQAVRVHASSWAAASLPLDRPVTVEVLLRDYVELQRTATRDDVAALAAACPCPPERRPLDDLAGLDAGGFDDAVTSRNISVLDLLERFRSVELTFDTYLSMSPRLEPRRYSISSSNIQDPGTVDLMVAVVDGPHRSETGNHPYRGVASRLLADLEPGRSIAARVVPCNDHFRVSPEQPVILVGAGTGLAPFRGMIAERRAALSTGNTAMAFVYFGCDHPDVDFLHREELEAAHDDGIISLRPTFTFAPVNGAKFVQERMIADADDIWSALTNGAHLRVCGDAARVGVGVDEALRHIHRQRAPQAERHPDGAESWIAALRREHRYVSDVW